MSTAAAAAAAARRRREEEEEEHMTPYTPRDLAENWEFKILRSATGAFKDPAVMQRSLAEEAQAGWTLTTLREKLIKIGAKVVAHAKYVIFQLAEVAVPRPLFARILERISQLRLACASG